MKDLNLNQNYSARLTGNPLLYFEMRTVAELKTQKMQDNEIRNLIISDNLFQYKTRKSITKRLGEVERRLKLLNPELIEKLAHSDSDTAKFICLYVILKSDRLFYEFMKEVLLDKHLSKNITIPASDFKSFFHSKSEQNAKISKWTDYTIKKLISAYKTILRHVGILEGDKVLKIKSPVIPLKLIRILKNNGDYSYVKVMLGE